MTAGTWKPAVGQLTHQLIEKKALDSESEGRLVESAVRSLSRCGDPAEKGDRSIAHLVVGEVQSGKTLAFTTLMALARDNGFRLIIVIAGTKNNLLEQTVERLNDDLLRGSGGLNPWRSWVSPKQSDAEDIRNLLASPRDPAAKVDGSQTAVCFVLKNASRLRSLRETLEAVGPSILGITPALVIDDEADQASLNLRHERGEQSPVYGAIAEMRSALPRHDFLMYTATPQGPLLVELEDELSPQTVTVLQSGPDYIGGSELFVEGRDQFVRLIPDAELEAALEPGDSTPAPPPSLRRAIATFLLALVVAQERENPRPLSMLIHPAATRDLHHQYASWVRSIRDDLVSKLADPKDAAFEEAVQADLLPAYEDLASTVSGLRPLGELAESVTPYAKQVEVREVNQGAKKDEIRREDWGNFPGWILVGGNKLERGFTVENLAVTYMPRGPGMGNADTIQQRGRFFGYKRKYIDLCRGWFTAEIADAFALYVEHEETMHEALRVVDDSGEPLTSWRREMVLSPALKPTRKKVMSLPTTRQAITSADGWFNQSHLFDGGIQAVNTSLAEWLFETYRAQADLEELDPRKRHRSISIPLAEASRVLAEWGAINQDADRLLGISLLIGRLLDDEFSSECRLVFMDGVESLADEQGRRRRTREQSGGPAMTVNVFQGRDPGTEYPGDREICDGELVTVQLHLLDLYSRERELWAEGVPAVAVHLPGDMTTLVLQS